MRWRARKTIPFGTRGGPARPPPHPLLLMIALHAFSVRGNMNGTWLWFSFKMVNDLKTAPKNDITVNVLAGEWLVGGTAEIYIEDYETKAAWHRTIKIE